MSYAEPRFARTAKSLSVHRRRPQPQQRNSESKSCRGVAVLVVGFSWNPAV
jgi:hypothetical protein